MSSGLAKRASATVVESPAHELVGRLQAFAEPGAERKDRHLVPSRRTRPLPISSGMPSSGIATPTAFAARIAQRRRPVVDRDRRSPPCEPVRLRRPPPSARSWAGSRDRRRRRSRHGSGRRRRQGRRGRSRSAPAGSGWRRRARPGRRRAAGRSNRSRERLEALGGEPGREGHAVLLGDADIEGAIGKLLCEQIEPVPDGIAAVMATILSSLRASLIRLSP